MNDPVPDPNPTRGEQPLYGVPGKPETGAPHSPADGPLPPYTAPYPPYPYDAPPTGGLSDNVAAGLAYFTVVPAILFLLLEPYRQNSFVRFHSWQSIFLFLAIAVMRSVEMMLVAMLPSAMAFTIGSLFSLLFFIAWLVATIKAFQGAKYLLPLVGDFAERTAASSSVR
jgi:uncharacterized membrane protein